MTGETPLPTEQLTESFRFDAELAALLTAFQYREDGITLTAAKPRPLPDTAYSASTTGLEAVFGAESAVVFVCYDNRSHRMVNPIEVTLIQALANAIHTTETGARPDGGTTEPLGEGPPATATTNHRPEQRQSGEKSSGDTTCPNLGVVTPHNAQRGALETALPDGITANTVEKYQGGERDIIAVSGTVSDPEFARREERFILNPRRLLVAISRSRLLTVVVCSTALFEVVPEDSDRLDEGPIWGRLFTQAVGRDAEPTWSGPLDEFVGEEHADHADVPVQVYPSSIDASGGGQ